MQVNEPKGKLRHKPYTAQKKAKDTAFPNKKLIFKGNWTKNDLDKKASASAKCQIEH